MKLNKTLVVTVALATILSACGGGAAPTVAPTSAPAATKAPAAAEPTKAPAAEPTKAQAAEPTKAPAATAAQKASGTRTKVRIISWWDATTSKPLQDLKAGFEAKNPDLELDFVQIPAADYGGKLLTTIAGGGDLPDVMMLAMDKVPLYADRGAIVNLDPFVKPEFKQDMQPVVLQALSYKGSLYAAPRDVSSRIMFLNKAMFDKAGVPLPKADWTWDDFRALAKKLTDPQAGTWGFYFPKYNDGFFHWLRQNNGGLVSEDGTQSILSKPESIEALHFLQDMIIKDKSVPTETQAQQFGKQDYAPFMANKVAMVAGSLSYTVDLNKNKVDYVIVPLPKGKRQMNTAFVNSWTIPKGAKNPQNSWRVLEYFSGKDGQQIVLDDGMGLPASKGVDASKFTAARPDNKVFIDAMSYAEPFPSPLYGVDFFTTVQKEFDLMWLGQRSVEDAVAAAEKAGNPILQGKS